MWLLARRLYSQAKSEEYPGLSMDWRDNVQTELQRADSMGILKHKSVWFWHPTLWFWVLSFSLLFSFSIVITAGYVTQLAGFGVIPIFCAYSEVDRNSWCLLLPNEKAKLRYARQWKTHQMKQTPAFASFFQSISAGVCCTFSFRQTTDGGVATSGLPSPAWKSAAKIANLSPLQMLYCSSSGVLPIHSLLPVYAVQADCGGNSALWGQIFSKWWLGCIEWMWVLLLTWSDNNQINKNVILLARLLAKLPFHLIYSNKVKPLLRCFYKW